MKVTFFLACTFNHSAKLKEVVEVEDDATDKDIDSAFEDWKNNNMECGWYKDEEPSRE